MSDPFLSEIRLFAGNYAPCDWMFCEGQTLQIAQYSALFAIIGNTYGGDGKTTFMLPDLRGRAPMHKGAGPNLTPRTLGQPGGVTTVLLNIATSPAHTHTMGCDNTNAATETSPEGAIWGRGAGRTPPKLYAPEGSVQMNSAALSQVGGNGAHNNMQPYVGLRFIICMSGIFPPRS